MVSASARDDATQKLVDEWERAVSSESLRRADALIRVVGAGGRMRDALEAAQRPPVNPEARVAIRAVVGEQLTKAGLDLNGPPYSDDGETQWPVALELRDRLTAAILARFSVPSRPPVSPEVEDALVDAIEEAWTDDDPEFSRVIARRILARFSFPTLDPEKVAKAARAEVNRAHPAHHDVGVGIVQGSHYRAGFVAGARWVAAALPSLTATVGDGTSSDSEKEARRG